MAYDHALADRVRQLLPRGAHVEERAMFGGLAFMVRGHMCCGLVRDSLMVRVDPDACDELLQEPGARPMDFTGRPLRGFLFVDGPGVSSARALRRWVSRAVEFAESLPPKTTSRRRPSSAGRRPVQVRSRAARVRRPQPSSKGRDRR